MVRKDPNKPRGRMTAYTFFVQTCRDEHKKSHPDESVVFADFSRQCAARWKLMNPKQKEVFQKMANKDQIRYEREMKDYTPPNDAKQTTKKRRRKDPNAPKRPQSAFFLFCADRRALIKEKNPSHSVGDIAKELGKLWGIATPEIKKKYEEQGQVAKAAYLKVMEKYKADQQNEVAESAKKQKKAAAPSSSSSSSSSSDDSDSN